MKIRKAESAIALLILVLAVLLVYPMLHKRDKMDAREITRMKMRQTAAQVLKYYSDNKAWPDTESWQLQVRPYLAQEKAFSPDGWLTDAWGKQLNYSAMTNAAGVSRFLQSLGPNHVDDRGSNDDIVIKLSD